MVNLVPVLTAAKRMLAQGDPDQAERLFRRVLTESPSNAAAARELGSLLLDQRRGEEAASVLLPAIRARPQDGELLALWGRGLYVTGQLAQATPTLERALQLAPQSVTARLWLARCRSLSHRAAEAIQLLTPLLPAHAENLMVRQALGQAHLVLTQADEATHHFLAAFEQSPTASAHADLGWALQMGGHYAKALERFDAAIALDPSDAIAYSGKATVQSALGEPEEARRTIEGAINRGLLQSTLLATYARLSKTPEQRRDARNAINQGLSALNLSPVDRGWLLLAYGALQEADGEYDAAFASFLAAHEPAKNHFDLAAYQRSCSRYAEIFSASEIKRLPRSSVADPLPVFIVGMPRSGTSLVEQILASHPLVHGAGELDDLPRLATDIPRLMARRGIPRYPDCIPALTPEDTDRLAAGHLLRLRKLGGAAERVTDKMPQNYIFLGLIDLLFPGARIIHCVRDPLDTCVSCYTTSFGQGHLYSASLANLVGVYRAYHELMAHWRSVVRVPILDVRYEDLVADPQGQTRRLIEFIGVPWEAGGEQCFRFHENRRVVRTASLDQVRQPVYTSSIGRWKKFEPHLGELIDGLKDLR